MACPPNDPAAHSAAVAQAKRARRGPLQPRVERRPSASFIEGSRCDESPSWTERTSSRVRVRTAWVRPEPVTNSTSKPSGGTARQPSQDHPGAARDPAGLDLGLPCREAGSSCRAPGRAVTNRGKSSPARIIHTVTTSASFPLGPFSLSLAWYFCPKGVDSIGRSSPAAAMPWKSALSAPQASWVYPSS